MNDHDYLINEFTLDDDVGDDDVGLQLLFKDGPT